MGFLLAALAAVSVVLMKDHYQYLQQQSVSQIELREKLSFHRYKLAMTNWLVLMAGVTLFLLSYQLISIAIILFFYGYILYLVPVLAHQFFK